MTSIAEKYAAQWMPNGEVSLADLIQAAVDEAVESRRHEVAMHAVQQIKAEIGQSVAAAGEPLTCDECGAATDDPWHSSESGSRHFHRCDACHSKQHAELATLREKAAMADELRKDAERYRWLKPRLRCIQQFAASGGRRLSLDIRIGCAFFDTFTPLNDYWGKNQAELESAIDAAMLAAAALKEDTSHD